MRERREQGLVGIIVPIDAQCRDNDRELRIEYLSYPPKLKLKAGLVCGEYKQ